MDVDITNIARTDLIPDTLSCGGVLLLWSMRLHILFVTLLAKQITCARLHYFHKMQNAMPILSQDTQERIAQIRSRNKSFSFDISFSRSPALLSRSLALCHL